jgi:hypothetical protein
MSQLFVEFSMALYPDIFDDFSSSKLGILTTKYNGDYLHVQDCGDGTGFVQIVFDTDKDAREVYKQAISTFKSMKIDLKR